MAYRFMRYPGGKAKAVTFSYDDGNRADLRLAECCDKYGVKCTFNINTVCLPEESGQGKISVEEIQQHLLDKGHEVAVHGHEHKAPGISTPVEIIQDVLTCRLILEEKLGRIIRGMAYPDSGIFITATTPYETIRRNLEDLGIVYSRTLRGDNDDFRLPTDWFAWLPTAHHVNPNALKWAENFVKMDVNRQYGAAQYPRLYYLWGHSFEFDRANNWDLLEQLCEMLGGKEDTWYATNIEIYDYVQAYEALQFSANGKRVYNPTLQTVWFKLGSKDYSVAPGETLLIE